MVKEVLRWQEQDQARVDLILCVGDFQAMRGEIDMRALACPAKYQQVPYSVKLHHRAALAVCSPHLKDAVGTKGESAGFIVARKEIGLIAARDLRHRRMARKTARSPAQESATSGQNSLGPAPRHDFVPPFTLNRRRSREIIRNQRPMIVVGQSRMGNLW